MLALWPVTTLNLLDRLDSFGKNLLQGGRLSYSVTRQKTQLRTRCCEGLRPDINNVLIDLRATRNTTRHKIINTILVKRAPHCNRVCCFISYRPIRFLFFCDEPTFHVGKRMH